MGSSSLFERSLEILAIHWKRKIEISNLGNVKLNGKLKQFKLSNKQKYYLLCGKYLHRIVATLFVPNPENKTEIDHIDGNTLNNSAANLRWCTHKENLNNPVTIKRYKISNKNKGCCKPGNQYRRLYEKGHIPWNKGKKFKKEHHPLYGKHKVYDNEEHTLFHWETRVI